MNNYVVQEDPAIASKYNKLEGPDRYQTAIEISKKAFKNGEAKAVVVVGGNALLDGLSASPLASAKDATVVLASGKNGLSAGTMGEISRATENIKGKTVYIIGGTDSVPSKVDKVLESKGAVVVRIAGADRYETSRKISEVLSKDGNIAKDANLFVVSGNGAADAMSVAPVASTEKENNKVSPILVVKKSGIDAQTQALLEGGLKASSLSNVYLVGGEDSLTNKVADSLSKISKKDKIDRLAGADRYSTNAQILDKFYSSTSGEKIKTSGVIVASGANKSIVDAQTAGSFAGKMPTPIVLAGAKLSDSQVAVLTKKGGAFLDSQSKADKGLIDNIYKVGGAVSSAVMATLLGAVYK